MGTPSRIGLELSDGSVLSVYHHYDGYPEWLGRILQTHYNSRSLASELIDGGDMSVCWTDERWTSYGSYKDDEYGPNYYSYRGEDCPPHLDKNLEEYLSDGEEYAYVYTKNNEWVCYNMNQFSDKEPEIVPIPSGALMV
jgi:hypothetical protein